MLRDVRPPDMGRNISLAKVVPGWPLLYERPSDLLDRCRQRPAWQQAPSDFFLDPRSRRAGALGAAKTN
jgi:hypothetical protein